VPSLLRAKAELETRCQMLEAQLAKLQVCGWEAAQQCNAVWRGAMGWIGGAAAAAGFDQRRPRSWCCLGACLAMLPPPAAAPALFCFCCRGWARACRCHCCRILPQICCRNYLIVFCNCCRVSWSTWMRPRLGWRISWRLQLSQVGVQLARWLPACLPGQLDGCLLAAMCCHVLLPLLLLPRLQQAACFPALQAM
jgi:hypothetical protein